MNFEGEEFEEEEETRSAILLNTKHFCIRVLIYTHF
ncbi:MAG: hypothetical protein ACI8RD_002318 [Bacillariaceae sp.]|jgi:hypothetical protein